MKFPLNMLPLHRFLSEPIVRGQIEIGYYYNLMKYEGEEIYYM